MTQHVWTPFLDIRHERQVIVNDTPYLRRLQRAPVALDKEWAAHVLDHVHPRGVIGLKSLGQLGAKGDDALLIALSGDTHFAASQINIGPLQGQKLSSSHAGTIKSKQDEIVALPFKRFGEMGLINKRSSSLCRTKAGKG